MKAFKRILGTAAITVASAATVLAAAPDPRDDPTDHARTVVTGDTTSTA